MPEDRELLANEGTRRVWKFQSSSIDRGFQCLPNLVHVHLINCGQLRHLSGLGKLHKLKLLHLERLVDLEYIDNIAVSSNISSVGALKSQELFFPSLEQLQLSYLEKLKGWWIDDHDSNTISTNQQHGLLLPSFPCLSKLTIYNCRNLGSMPLCPIVEDIQIETCIVNLRIMECVELGNSKLRSLVTDQLGHLKLALPTEAFQSTNRIYIRSDRNDEKLLEVERVFRSCSSSLKELQIHTCVKLKSVSGGLEHLTALERLTLSSLYNLSLSKAGEGEEDIDEEMPWRCLHHSLGSLELHHLPKLVKLPNGMRHLTALQSLTIEDCKALELVPEWMPEFTSLKKLEIKFCSYRLTKRCLKYLGTGEDWPYIQHIPDFFYTD